MGIGKFLVVLMAGALAGCAGSGGLKVSSGERYDITANVNETYLLGSGDKVRVTVYGEPNLTGEFAVAADGTLSLPLVGDVPAAGKTTRLVADEFAKKLSDGFLANPNVAMEVSAYRPFFILGEVNTPGQYPYVNGMTAMNAIATAGGYTPRATRKVIFIRKFGEAAETEYDLKSTLRIMPGDTIRLGERYF
ncbi:polysaccharide biosynthesis/export family protein [Novosphingobium sp. Rr 2-17]|uniref:polysaccharide biosynthesis/export family protein n=1 Tax=Novosphingobium sp. Rr 2-17 TaxID=555793 RepID=UPI0002698206|nr:polysaccharide biosynthesis/export family protein [Novosphingobium sp. Rr 2-17]EIZ79030.1 polysaccharide biosynthesis/export family protein [Novosphingobium sp. Rr 2-17]